MFGGEHHERCAEQRVGSRGEDGDRASRRFEVDLGAVAAADPVALHRLDGLGPIEQLEVVDQAVGIRSDTHHPLPHVALEHREVATVGTAVGGNFFVCHDSAQTGTPVDRRLRDIGQAMVVDDLVAFGEGELAPASFVECYPIAGLELGDQLIDRPRPFGILVVPGVEHLAEDPLRPPVVLRVSGRDRAPHVVTQPEATQLAPHVFDVGVCRDCWVGSGLYGVLLRR